MDLLPHTHTQLTYIVFLFFLQAYISSGEWSSITNVWCKHIFLLVGMFIRKYTISWQSQRLWNINIGLANNFQQFKSKPIVLLDPGAKINENTVGGKRSDIVEKVSTVRWHQLFCSAIWVSTENKVVAVLGRWSLLDHLDLPSLGKRKVLATCWAVVASDTQLR